MGEVDRGGSGGREDSGRGERGADGTHFLVRFVITADDKVISW